MSQTVITTAFEALKAQQAAANAPVVLDEFVFANIPNLNITDPIDPAEAMPAAGQIVHRASVGKTGVVNANAVVYSVTLGADVGDFSFNWVGLRDTTSNTLAMIVHAPVQQKVKNNAGTQGNVLTRSFLMEYDGAKKETQITTPAGTWQIDFTARLAGMDERQRVENVDIYGAGAFIGEGFLVKRNGNNYSVTAGTGYVGGLRTVQQADQALTVSTKPVKVWVDACWKGTLTSVWQVATALSVADTLANYVKDDVQHYVFAIAQINADGSVTDLRKNIAFLKQENNLSDVPNKATARGNLELKSAALKDAGVNKGQIPLAEDVFKSMPLQPVIPGKDFNDFVETGYHNVSCDDLSTISHYPVLANKSSPYSYGQLVVYSDGNVVTQTYISHRAEVATRQKWGESWNAWAAFFSSGNPPVPQDVGALPADGNAVSATKLNTARRIAGKSFDGTADIDIGPGDVGALPAGGNAVSATKLNTSRRIAGKSFDGTADIDIGPGDVGALPAGGNAVSATKLNTSRRIAGKSFDGTADIDIGPGDVGALSADALGGIPDSGSFAPFTESGFYWVSINYPETVSDMPKRRNGTPCYGYGSLFVISAGSSATQIYISDQGDFATRQYWGGWHDWKVMYSTASNPTPGDIGAFTTAESEARYVSDVQLGAGTRVTTWNTSGNWPNSAGYVITSVFKDAQDQWLDGVTYAPLQKRINNQWWTVNGGAA